MAQNITQFAFTGTVSLQGVAKATQAAGKLDKANRKAAAASDLATKKGRKNAQAFLELSRGFEDFSSVFATRGLVGGIQGAANNLAQVGQILGGPGKGAVVGFGVAIASILIPQLVGSKKAAKEAEEGLERYRNQLSKIKKEIKDLADQKFFDLNFPSLINQKTKGKGPEEVRGLFLQEETKGQELARKETAQLTALAETLRKNRQLFPSIFKGGFGIQEILTGQKSPDELIKDLELSIGALDRFRGAGGFLDLEKNLNPRQKAELKALKEQLQVLKDIRKERKRSKAVQDALAKKADEGLAITIDAQGKAEKQAASILSSLFLGLGAQNVQVGIDDPTIFRDQQKKLKNMQEAMEKLPDAQARLRRAQLNLEQKEIDKRFSRREFGVTTPAALKGTRGEFNQITDAIKEQRKAKDPDAQRQRQIEQEKLQLDRKMVEKLQKIVDNLQNTSIGAG